MKAIVLPAFAVALALSPGFALEARSAAAPFNPRDLEGVWLEDLPADGHPMMQINYPLNDKYARILKARAALHAQGKTFDGEMNPCVPGPIVRMMTAAVGAPVEIGAVHDDHYIVTKENGSIYRIYMKRGHKGWDDITPGQYGDAVGHWEGDTLVVDSIGLGGNSDIDGVTPHSDKFHVVQHIRRTAADKLEDRLTLDDPLAFTHAIDITVTYTAKPGWEMGEFFCTNDREVSAPAP